jgi:hypothetical protein
MQKNYRVYSKQILIIHAEFLALTKRKEIKSKQGI